MQPTVAYSHISLILVHGQLEAGDFHSMYDQMHLGFRWSPKVAPDTLVKSK